MKAKPEPQYCSVHWLPGTKRLAYEADAGWACQTCSHEGINKCACGSPARIFGEAMYASVSCESCDEILSTVCGASAFDLRAAWNSGLRGHVTAPQLDRFPPSYKRYPTLPDVPDADAFGL